MMSLYSVILYQISLYWLFDFNSESLLKKKSHSVNVSQCVLFPFSQSECHQKASNTNASLSTGKFFFLQNTYTSKSMYFSLIPATLFSGSFVLAFLLFPFYYYAHLTKSLLLFFFWLVSSNQYIFCFSLIFVTATSTTT